MKIPMKRTLSLALLTGLFALSGIAWCSVANGDNADDAMVQSINGTGDKTAKVPADGGGERAGVISKLTDAEQGDGSESSGEGDAETTSPPALDASGDATRDGAADEAGDAGATAAETGDKKNEDKNTQEKSTQTDDFADDKININTASAEDMVNALKGIGPKKAQAIIDYREAKGPFTQVDQLTEVKGIGPSTLSHIKELIVLE